mgnify:CR=1 FL=1
MARLPGVEQIAQVPIERPGLVQVPDLAAVAGAGPLDLGEQLADFSARAEEARAKVQTREDVVARARDRSSFFTFGAKELRRIDVEGDWLDKGERDNFVSLLRKTMDDTIANHSGSPDSAALLFNNLSGQLDKFVDQAAANQISASHVEIDSLLGGKLNQLTSEVENGVKSFNDALDEWHAEFKEQTPGLLLEDEIRWPKEGTNALAVAAVRGLINSGDFNGAHNFMLDTPGLNRILTLSDRDALYKRIAAARANVTPGAAMIAEPGDVIMQPDADGKWQKVFEVPGGGTGRVIKLTPGSSAHVQDENGRWIEVANNPLEPGSLLDVSGDEFLANQFLTRYASVFGEGVGARLPDGKPWTQELDDQYLATALQIGQKARFGTPNILTGVSPRLYTRLAQRVYAAFKKRGIGFPQPDKSGQIENLGEFGQPLGQQATQAALTPEAPTPEAPPPEAPMPLEAQEQEFPLTPEEPTLEEPAPEALTPEALTTIGVTSSGRPIVSVPVLDDAGNQMLDDNGEPVTNVLAERTVTIQLEDGTYLNAPSIYDGKIVSVPVLDDAGNPMLDDNGKPVTNVLAERTVTIQLEDGTYLNAPSIYDGKIVSVPVLDDAGNPMLDDNGNIIYDTQEILDRVTTEDGQYVDPETGRVLPTYSSRREAERAAVDDANNLGSDQAMVAARGGLGLPPESPKVRPYPTVYEMFNKGWIGGPVASVGRFLTSLPLPFISGEAPRMTEAWARVQLLTNELVNALRKNPRYAEGEREDIAKIVSLTPGFFSTGSAYMQKIIGIAIELEDRLEDDRVTAADTGTTAMARKAAKERVGIIGDFLESLLPERFGTNLGKDQAKLAYQYVQNNPEKTFLYEESQDVWEVRRPKMETE